MTAASRKRGVEASAIATLVVTFTSKPPRSRGNSHGPARAATDALAI